MTADVLNWLQLGKLFLSIWNGGYSEWNQAHPDGGRVRQKGQTKFSATFSSPNYKINISCHMRHNTSPWFIIQSTRWKDWAREGATRACLKGANQHARLIGLGSCCEVSGQCMSVFVKSAAWVKARFIDGKQWWSCPVSLFNGGKQRGIWSHTQM